jgi:cysteine desulfurase/selenocysteine lyase
MLQVKSDFPILSQKVNGKPITYLDSGATSQKPQILIDAITKYYTKYNANIHRGLYYLSEKSTLAVDEAREKVKKFINANSTKEIIFTRNATESINLIAFTWARENCLEGDEIVTTVMEHHANIVPWQILVAKSGSKLIYVNVTDEGYLDLEDFEKSLSKKTKLVCLVHVSNVVGTINPIKKLIKIVRKNAPNAKVLVDACQSVPHMKVDVLALDADFLAFSGHKMMAPTGIGVLYAKEEILNEMPPFMTGGDMISEVHLDGSKWNDLPYKFEAGTPHIEGIIGLGTAIDYINSIGIENIEKHEQELVKYAFEKLSKIKEVTILGPQNPKDHAGLIAFELKGIHPHDVAEILNQENIYIRSGHHCAQPLHEKLGYPQGSARASFYVYNELSDVDRLVKGIGKVLEVFN